MNEHPSIRPIKIDSVKKKNRIVKRLVVHHSTIRKENRFTIQGVGESYSTKCVNEHLNYADVTPNNTSTITSGATLPNVSIEKRPQQIFSNEQEKELSEFVRDASDYYNGLTSKDVRILAFVYGVCNQVDLPAGWRVNHQATFSWCSRFTKRFQLSLLIAGNSS
ncbi:uncharacterized protein LOC119071327 [Bradysia coprophila]|uniref:uncharacterized protein LOC119071327 n=1 Tax=Bradysia coprophila TaxID=38358 RepID=UPI00187D81F0|nr:uncharacterized protein LOC119071327 [Bradysia coprophila]